MNCPKCNSSKKVKNGIVRNLQRFKCKDCLNNYTVLKKSTAVSSAQRRLGLMMYLEGLGFNSIGRLLGVSHVAVIKWVKKYGNQLSETKNNAPVRIMEMDEMHSYIGSKKTIVGCGLQLIETKKDALISLLETGDSKQGNSYGIKSKKLLRAQ